MGERQRKKMAAHRRNLNKTAQLHWEIVHEARQSKYNRKKRRSRDDG